jgi:hypothetical protein
MTLNTIICGYIYAGFLLLKSALEAGLVYAKAIIKSIDSLVMAIENMIKLTCLEIINAALAAYQILCKYLTDWIMQKTHAKDLLDKFCKSIFKCSYILKELLNPSSPITKTLQQYSGYDATAQANLYKDISDYDSFRNQICSSGFTFMWGLNYLRDKGEDILAKINEWVDVITRNRNRIRKKLESYFYAIDDFGILDLLRQLSVFFNCILSPEDETCASIATSQNFYRKCMGALHIKETGYGQFKLTESWLKQKLGICDNVTLQLNQVKNNLAIALTDAGITSKNLANAQNAYNLANFVRDTKRAFDKGNWTAIPGVKWFKSTFDDAAAFGSALAEAMSEIGENVDLSFDSILEFLKVKDNRVVYANPAEVDTIDLTDIFFPDGSSGDGSTIYVGSADVELATDSMNRFYWTEDGQLVSMSYVVDSLVNGTDEKLNNDIDNKMRVINAMSDTTFVLNKY